MLERSIYNFEFERWRIIIIIIGGINLKIIFKVEDFLKIEKAESHEIDPVMEFEPSVHSVLQQLVPMYITNSIFQALLEANASELAARMTAMSAASNNAEEMINTLTIDYNKARQSAITQELVEIVSGAQGVQ